MKAYYLTLLLATTASLHADFAGPISGDIIPEPYTLEIDMTDTWGPNPWGNTDDITGSIYGYYDEASGVWTFAQDNKVAWYPNGTSVAQSTGHLFNRFDIDTDPVTGNWRAKYHGAQGIYYYKDLGVKNGEPPSGSWVIVGDIWPFPQHPVESFSVNVQVLTGGSPNLEGQQDLEEQIHQSVHFTFEDGHFAHYQTSYDTEHFIRLAVYYTENGVQKELYRTDRTATYKADVPLSSTFDLEFLPFGQQAQPNIEEEPTPEEEPADDTVPAVDPIDINLAWTSDNETLNDRQENRHEEELAEEVKSRNTIKTVIWERTQDIIDEASRSERNEQNRWQATQDREDGRAAETNSLLGDIGNKLSEIEDGITGNHSGQGPPQYTAPEADPNQPDYNAIQTSVSNLLGLIPEVTAFPTVTGRNYDFQIMLPTYKGADFSFNLDLNPYASIIELIRTLEAALVVIMFVISVIATIKGGFAS